MASLPQEIAAEIDALVAVPSQSMSLDSGSCWLDVDRTAIPTSKNLITAYYGILLDTKNGETQGRRHILVAHHVNHTTGDVYYFKDAGGTTHTRTDAGYSRIGSTDIGIVTLDSDLPSGVTPCKVFSAGFRSKILESNRVPVWGVRQNRNVQVMDITDITSNPSANYIGATTPTDESRLDYFDQIIIPGDSGSPVGVVLDGVLITLGTWNAGGGGVTLVSEYITAINSAISPYVLTEVSIASYTNAPTATITTPSGFHVNPYNATVSWSSTDAASATLNGDAVATSGSDEFALTETTEFTFVATNEVGSISDSGTVQIVEAGMHPENWPETIILITPTASGAGVVELPWDEVTGAYVQAGALDTGIGWVIDPSGVTLGEVCVAYLQSYTPNYQVSFTGDYPSFVFNTPTADVASDDDNVNAGPWGLTGMGVQTSTPSSGLGGLIGTLMLGFGDL